MNAGDLNRRVTLLRSVAAEDDFGSGDETWGAFAEVSASRRDISDGERMRAAEMGATLTTRFQIRWSPEVEALSPADQLICEGRRYEISGVKEITAGSRVVGLEITATFNADLPLIL
jgi:SPP1 family predicted phage head-tail adaptor